MFLAELKRIKRMICEVVFPTMAKCEPAKTVPFYYKRSRPTMILRHSYTKDSFQATTLDLFFHDANSNDPMVFELDIWCKRTNDKMESIEVDMRATYSPLDKDNIELERHESLFPDVDFLEDMEMKDIDQLALIILKKSRILVQTLRERALS